MNDKLMTSTCGCHLNLRSSDKCMLLVASACSDCEACSECVYEALVVRETMHEWRAHDMRRGPGASGECVDC